MNACSVLLVNPALGLKQRTREDLLRSYLSLGTLAAALQDQVFRQKFARASGRFEPLPETHVRVLNLDGKPQNLGGAGYLRSFLAEEEFRPDLIGMTATSTQLDEAAELARAAAEFVPDALRVIGGPHVSAAPFEFMKKSRFQVACVGEGVETLLDIVAALAEGGIQGLSGVSGIALKNDTGEISLHSAREPILPLNDYPFPSDALPLFLEDIDHGAKNRRDLVYVLAGSGCPYGCIFCAQRAIHVGRVRERSAENLFAEIKNLSLRGFRRFALVQETFLRDKERAGRFCSLVETSGLPIEWTIEARADQLDFETLKKMKRAGLKFLQLGVESGDPAVLKNLGKTIDLGQVTRARDMCEELDIDTAFYMLAGLPGQDWQSILRSALFVKDHLPVNRITRHISTSIAVPYPGTRIYAEKSVRLIGRPSESMNWPGRDGRAHDEEPYAGESGTETDAMVSTEIMEAYGFLDDFGSFLLEAKYNPECTPGERRRAEDFAYRLLYIIGRRTLRDLIIQAQPGLDAAAYREARSDILRRDGGAEAHLRDVLTSTELWPDFFFRFLAAAKFENGFHAMKVLSVPERIRWMKVCGIVWAAGERFSKIGFAVDDEEQGRILQVRLQHIADPELNEFLVNAADGTGCRKVDFRGNTFGLFGIDFDHEQSGLVLMVRSFANMA
ncbi:MAG TPA: radical SAM protein [Thermodesulfobacteriota bacterium]|nr:radical SAM protein [Thermodesulfobacteriota bacterium]